MRIKVRIRKHEFGLWFRHGDFVRVLAPGAYWLPGRLIPRRHRIENGSLLRRPAAGAVRGAGVTGKTAQFTRQDLPH